MLNQSDYSNQLHQQPERFVQKMRKQNQLVEFSGFLRAAVQARHELKESNLMDAHSNILRALHHWGNLALIEEGAVPEATVWKQIKRYNPGIYKLYEELTISPETLEQRVKLVLLGCEFSIGSKLKTCCELIIDVLGSREEAWGLSELSNHPILSGLEIDLSLLLQKLVTRDYINEVAVVLAGENADRIELKYRPATRALSELHS
ncbi:hypothetical protein EBB07_21660 [Paenibacillaceae bacterium]|nr:hypothetical protein EBB07_21660 [Paenibacillaceae bacterium]